jgi:hypothetical protein
MSKKTVYWVVAEVSPKNAGYRVRTVPLAKALERYSISPVIISTRELIDSVQSIVIDALAVIVAKPSDTETFLCMKYLLAHDVRVLADLFDNYFSWSASLYKRAVPWQWLRAIKTTSGICASTPFIAETVSKLGISDVSLISDPSVETLEVANFSSSDLHPKWYDPEQLELLWFGISSNPYCYAGIDDLISWERVISYIRDRLGGLMRLRLTICTNRVPAVEAAIMYFHSAGINTRFVEWTEKICDELLLDSHLVLIPSNLSGFSLSKTHNRCSDALWRQCLALTSPNGPYHDIPGAVYRDINVLCNDLSMVDHTHITNVINQSRRYLFQTHALSEQAYNLAKFIFKKNKPNSKMNVSKSLLPPILLAGSGSSGAIVKLSRKLGYLSASARDFEFKLNFDFLLTSIDADDATVTFEINKTAKRSLESGIEQSNYNELEAVVLDLQEMNGITILTLKLPELKPLLKSVTELRSIVSNHIDLHNRLFEFNITIIIVSLRYLGFNDFDLSATEAGGWESYIAHGNSELEMSAKKLQQLWKVYQGNEIGIGRPNQFESSNRTGVFNV